jgi:hypothetical protein
MSIRKFENKMLQKISQIDEGFALGLLKMFFKPAVKRAFKDIKEKDPELFADMESLEYYAKQHADRIKRYKDMLKSDDPDRVAFAKEMLKLFK